jgi:hypothetical protein
MPEPTSPERALGRIAGALTKRHRSFALVGGLAVSMRSEVRFTRDVDVAVRVDGDADAESLVLDLASDGFRPVASVEHETVKRLSTVRLKSPEGVVVDLLFASSGIEAEIVDRATVVAVPDLGTLPVARAEELLAMKILSMRDDRLQDRIDAQRLVQIARVDLDVVRDNLRRIAERGFDRGQDLLGKLAGLVVSVEKLGSTE